MVAIPSEPADKTPDSDTLAQRAASALQRDLLAGGFAPQARLAVQELARRYGIGATPIREALSRLAAQGLVVAIGRRGFRVADIGPGDLADITRLRLLVEREALRLSILKGGEDWEAGIVTALHLLTMNVRAAGTAFGEGEGAFDDRHKGFHTALIAGCGSRRMRDTASMLYDQAYRYRRLMMRTLTSPGDFINDHKQLAERTLARDFQAAGNLLSLHLRFTLRAVYPGDREADSV